MDGKRSRNWFCTINNYSDDEMLLALGYTCEYKLVAKEVGEKCGTPHLHLYLEHKDAKTFTSIKKKFPRANIQVALGNAEQNKRYLSKQELVLETGKPKKQGKRTDIEEVRELFQEHASMREIVSVARSVQSVRMAEIYFKYLEPSRKWESKVYWFCGPTGTGKSLTAREYFEADGRDYYETMDNGKWWEGYDAHENVIIDDLREDTYSFKTLLRLTDRYGYRVEHKGSSRQLLAKEIIITAPKSPQAMFQFCGEDVKQLLRRIYEIRHFDEDGGTESHFPDRFGNIVSVEYIEAEHGSGEEEFEDEPEDGSTDSP